MGGGHFKENNMASFKVLTKESIFKPIEIEVDNKLYKIERIPGSVLKKALKYEDEVVSGNISATVSQLHLLTDIPESKLMEIDIRILNKMLQYILDKMYHPEEKDLKKKIPTKK